MCAARCGGQASGVRALSSHAIESHQCKHCGWHMELLAPSHLYALLTSSPLQVARSRSRPCLWRPGMHPKAWHGAPIRIESWVSAALNQSRQTSAVGKTGEGFSHSLISEHQRIIHRGPMVKTIVPPVLAPHGNPRTLHWVSVLPDSGRTETNAKFVNRNFIASWASS